jgi:replication-associated recombination protein RarA
VGRRPPLTTKNGRDFYEVASLLQKSLRRGDIVMGARAVNELLPRYANYVWNRLLTVSAEDCADLVTAEVVGLYDAWCKVNEGDRDDSKGRVFLAKAVIVLAQCRHSRDADELNLLVADRIPDSEFDAAIQTCEAVAVDDAHWTIPAYVYDVHTRRGRKQGKTKAQFIREEHDALTDPTTVFVNFDEMAASREYVQPELPWSES